MSLASPALAGGFLTTSTTWEGPTFCMQLTASVWCTHRSMFQSRAQSRAGEEMHEGTNNGDCCTGEGGGLTVPFTCLYFTR